MLRIIARPLATIALAIAAIAAPIAATGAESGFLKDYSRLKPEKDAAGIERRVWVSPALKAGKYPRVFIEPVVFHPAPQPTDQLPAKSLEDIRAYLDSALRQAVGGALPLADQPGPGVARVRVAVTATAVEEGFKPYQLIPVALVITVAKAAAGKTKHDAKLAVEWEIADSASGETLALVVRPAKGFEVNSGEVLTLAAVKPRIDDWAESLRQFLAARLRGGAK